MKKKMGRKQTGISLVALVVTIVVLLILAGITLVYVLGDNGVFSKAQDAKNRTENAIEDEKEYMNGIGNTIDKHTNGTGGGITNPDTPEPEEPTISDSSSTSHTATTIDYTWEQINKIAEAIAKSDSVDSETMEVTANVDGTECIIGIGDITRVNYTTPETTEAKTESRRVRVLGFKHDDLVNTSAYGSGTTATKASISFEFLDFITGDTYKRMNPTSTNKNGWGATQMRKDLNGYTTNDEAQGGEIGGEGANLSNKQYIKQVKKQYIKAYNDASSNENYTQDYLWLLACSEIIDNGHNTGMYAYAKTTEGSQYKYYQGVTETWNEKSTSRTKYNALNSADWWWLRSPYHDNIKHFCAVGSIGNMDNPGQASSDSGVAPGFAI